LWVVVWIYMYITGRSGQRKKGFVYKFHRKKMYIWNIIHFNPILAMEYPKKNNRQKKTSRSHHLIHFPGIVPHTLIIRVFFKRKMIIEGGTCGVRIALHPNCIYSIVYEFALLVYTNHTDHKIPSFFFAARILVYINILLRLLQKSSSKNPKDLPIVIVIWY